MFELVDLVTSVKDFALTQPSPMHWPLPSSMPQTSFCSVFFCTSRERETPVIVMSVYQLTEAGGRG
jgi:hypothetical protein